MIAIGIILIVVGLLIMGAGVTDREYASDWTFYLLGVAFVIAGIAMVKT